MMKDKERFLAKPELAQALREQGLRHDWVAAQVGISESLLSRVLRRQRTVSGEVAMRIVGLLRVPFFVAFELPIRRNEDRTGLRTEAAEAAAS
jgi:transcriptional regulator with XRE-family HTH domain